MLYEVITDAKGRIRCPDCGKKLPQDTRICPRCGYDIETPDLFDDDEFDDVDDLALVITSYSIHYTKLYDAAVGAADASFGIDFAF